MTSKESFQELTDAVNRSNNKIELLASSLIEFCSQMKRYVDTSQRTLAALERLEAQLIEARKPWWSRTRRKV